MMARKPRATLRGVDDFRDVKMWRLDESLRLMDDSRDMLHQALRLMHDFRDVWLCHLHLQHHCLWRCCHMHLHRQRHRRMLHDGSPR